MTEKKIARQSQKVRSALESSDTVVTTQVLSRLLHRTFEFICVFIKKKLSSFKLININTIRKEIRIFTDYEWPDRNLDET